MLQCDRLSNDEYNPSPDMTSGNHFFHKGQGSHVICHIILRINSFKIILIIFISVLLLTKVGINTRNIM